MEVRQFYIKARTNIILHWSYSSFDDFETYVLSNIYDETFFADIVNG